MGRLSFKCEMHAFESQTFKSQIFFNRDLLKLYVFQNFMSFKKLYVFKKSAYISYPCKVKHFIYDNQQFPNNKFSFHRLLAVD